MNPKDARVAGQVELCKVTCTPNIAEAGSASYSLLAIPHPPRYLAPSAEYFGGAWDSSGGGGEGDGKEGMRFKPWVTVQALCSLTCHSETGLSQRFCWPELPEWSMKEFWSIWAISVHSNFKTHALGTE